MTERTEFEIAGTKFRLTPLKLEPALRGEQIVAEALFPALAAGVEFVGERIKLRITADTIRSALAGTRALPELVGLFAGACQVDWQGKWVDLPAFADLVFARRNAALLAWLLACVEWQYADFFGGDGLALVGAQASRLISQLGSTGASGESPPTPG